MRKKLLLVVLTISILVLSACGNTAQPTMAEDNTNPSTEDTTETEPQEAETAEPAEPEEPEAPTETVVATDSYDNLQDWVIGTDISVEEMPDSPRRVSNLPPLAIKLPEKDNLLETIDCGSAWKYCISIPETDNCVSVYCELYWAKNECLCLSDSLHKELTNYGKYSFDYGYYGRTANIIVGCPDVDTSIFISLDIWKNDGEVVENTEDIAEFGKFVDENVEYIREQVEAWDQSYEPTGELSATISEDTGDTENTEFADEYIDENGVVYNQETTDQWIQDNINSFYRTFSQDGGSCTYTVVAGENGFDTITASDGTNTYEFNMDNFGEGAYAAISDGNTAFEIYETEEGREVHAVDEKFLPFEGIYH